MARRKSKKVGKTLFAWADLNDPALVYIARNTINGNCYVGVTRRSLDERRRRHLWEAKRGVRGRFYNAIRKYGEEAFAWSVITECGAYHEALAEEVTQVALLKPAYNVTRGGEGALGYRHTSAELKRMSERRLGNPGFWLGKKRPAETIEKIRRTKAAQPPVRPWLGKKRDPATIEKIRAKKLGVKRTQPADPSVIALWTDNMRRAAAARRKPVICLNDGRWFESAQAASLAYGFSKNAVAAVCNPKKHNTNSIYGLRFAYAEGAK